MADTVVAFDFESFGGIPIKHGFTQLGAVVVDLETGEVLAEFNEYANQTGYTKEERCMREFWAQYPEVLAKNLAMCDKSENSPFQVVELFWKWVDEHVPDKSKCYMVTDNAPYDAGLLRAFSRTRDILYGLGTYRAIVDVSMWYYGRGKVSLTAEKLDNTRSKIAALEALGKDKLPDLKVKHSHHAVDDAKSIAGYWTWFLKENKV